MSHAEGPDHRKLLNWDELVIGEQLPTLDYVLTQEMMDEFRLGVMDPEAAFPTISQKVDVRPYHLVYRDDGSVNARCSFHFYNPPVAGKRIVVHAWIADKYARRGKNYIVTEAVSVDEDGRLLDRVITHELKQPSEVGKKWQ
jgi:predicted alpha-1,6-mannanase (GH76 family)